MEERSVSARDGTRIYYTVEGPADAELDLLLCDGIGCDGFIWRHLRSWFPPRARVLHPHYRGHGRSEGPRDPAAVGIADLVDDARAVLDAEGSRRAVVFGHSMGVQVALETWHRHHDRVGALVLMCGSFENPVATFHDGRAMLLALPVLRAVARKGGRPFQRAWQRLIPLPFSVVFAKLTEIHADFIRDHEFQPYLDHLAKVEPRLFFDMMAGAAAHSAREYLPHVDVPVLVVAGEQDRFTPAWLSEEMGRRIPTAEMLVVPEGTHVAPLEQPTLVGTRIGRFLETWFPPAGQGQSS
jgi:pimeloyl-ACP methyl ester carboxylesterase